MSLTCPLCSNDSWKCECVGMTFDGSCKRAFEEWYAKHYSGEIQLKQFMWLAFQAGWELRNE